MISMLLGSPRYSGEWLAKLKALLPPSPLEHDAVHLRIVLFLRKNEFTIFWEDVGEATHMIAAFPDITLMIKPPTRDGWKRSGPKSQYWQLIICMLDVRQ